MRMRTIAGTEVSEIGLGCMNVSHAYGDPLPPAEGATILLRALELGITHFDTATLYGGGRNQSLLGNTLKDYRQQFYLASKCGMALVDGKKTIDGRPETIKAQCDASLQQLQTDVIDLYYLHRWDKVTPIEDSMGAMADLIKDGKIRAVGLSEASAQTIRKAHAVCPISAVQSEYSPWSRNVEIAVLDTCREIGAAFVAFSPLARGMLANGIKSLEVLRDKDIRRNMPRFQEPNFSQNLKLVEQFDALAAECGVTPAQLCLKWVLSRGDFVQPIPGTTSLKHLEENVRASDLDVDQAILNRVSALINQATVSGPRYPAATQLEIDTEEFA